MARKSRKDSGNIQLEQLSTTPVTYKVYRQNCETLRGKESAAMVSTIQNGLLDDARRWLQNIDAVPNDILRDCLLEFLATIPPGDIFNLIVNNLRLMRPANIDKIEQILQVATLETKVAIIGVLMNLVDTSSDQVVRVLKLMIDPFH
jgi:hypothetical protein